jgi:hypothetical protein
LATSSVTVAVAASSGRLPGLSRLRVTVPDLLQRH